MISEDLSRQVHHVRHFLPGYRGVADTTAVVIAIVLMVQALASGAM